MGKSQQLQEKVQQWLTTEEGTVRRTRNEKIRDTVAKLPAKLRPIGFAIYGFDESGDVAIRTVYHHSVDSAKVGATNKWIAKWQPKIDSISAADRKKIFAVIGKDIAPWLETTWQNLKTATLTNGYRKTPFRTPKNPELSLESRIAWLQQFANISSRVKVEALNPIWLATWSANAFQYRASYVSPLLIATMNCKGKVGDEVFDILHQTVTRDHPIGIMSDFVIESLLGSKRQKGWEIIEKTLLAAQRQEGLRQSILEAADLAHPDAFHRVLQIIVDENLIRFSSVARAIDVWLRLLWDSASTKALSENVEAVLSFAKSTAKHKTALKSDDAETVYRALWFLATEDAVEAMKQAKKLLKHKHEEIRYVSVWILHQLGFDLARHAKTVAIDDENLQVAVLASCGLSGLEGDTEVIENLGYGCGEPQGKSDYFEKMEGLYQRLPEKPKTLEPIVWPWTERTIKRSDLCGNLLSTIGDRPPTRMLPYLKGLKQWSKTAVIKLLGAQKKWDKLTRETLMELTGSASADVRAAAFEALSEKKLSDDEYLTLEGYLSRTATDLRQTVVERILKQDDPKVLASAERLLASTAKKRLAGLEIVRQMAEADRSRKECVEIARLFSETRKTISKDEAIQLSGILESDRPVWTLDNGLGLMNPDGRSKVIKPQKKKGPLITKSAMECIKSLDALVHKHRAESVRCKTWNGWEDRLLGEVSYELPHLNLKKPLPKQLEQFPLWETWAKWRKDRPAKCRDKDGLELLRATTACSFMDRWNYDSIKEFANRSAEQKKIAKAVLGEFQRPKLQYLHIVHRILQWLLHTEIPKGVLDYLLDCKENACAHVTETMQEKLLHVDESERRLPLWRRESNDWRDEDVFEVWKDALNSFTGITQAKKTAVQQRRHFELDRFWDEPVPGAPRRRLGIGSLASAFQNKYATHDDLVDALIGPGREDYRGFGELSTLTERLPDKSTMETLGKIKGLPQLVDNLREKLLEIELARGEKATVSTDAALQVSCFYGIESLFRIQEALSGEYKVLTGWSASTADSRPATLTSLIKSTFPLGEETSSDFIKRARQAIKDGYFSEDQLLQLAFLAPQWSKFVGEMLEWKGFSEGLYWFLAHMHTWNSDARQVAASAEGIVDEETDDVEEDDDNEDGETAWQKPPKLSPWERLILERTPLSLLARNDGEVDVEWFHRTFALLGKDRWARMAKCAKLSANAAQAKKAQFVADALLGNTPRSKVIEGIKKRNLKENVRLLGLLPLAKGAKRDKDIQERYKVLLDYKKYARKLSSLTKPEAFRALEIGMNNLARTAGYLDPLRLEWALEAESTKDLTKGPVSITKDGVTVTLALDEDAQPQLSIRRGEKGLKSIPAKLRKKHASISELNDRAKELRKKSSRIKQSLEAAMCRGDIIEGGELAQLMKHAILAPTLKRLVLIGEGIAGYPDKGGKALRDHRGNLEPVKKKEQLRIAHSADLLELGDWDKWQRECFQAERIQPFKQIFRELYVPTKSEKSKNTTTRFSGQQIGPKQAMALWGSRGWNTQDEIVKIFHDKSIIAGVSFQYDIGTAAEIEGLTMETVQFQDRDTYKLIKLKDVPSNIFSEVMRDVDLVVSVAHRGEVDPEASESTVEMRSTLIRETCQLLSLKNVKFKPSHVVIKGHYGEYSLHLGSGNIHRMPGGFLAIIPVHAQHRSRMFLPFADNDPKTAEIVSKVLLLAKDQEIMDPTILEQLGTPLESRNQINEDSDESKAKAKPGKKKGKASSKKKRRFEFSEGKSNKFWVIERNGNSIKTTWGRVGSKGQSKTKEFATEAKAKESFEKLISGKTGKGYREI